MATNCPQLLKPRACRSALCCRTAVSKPVREMSCKICEKMLHTRFKAESSSDSSSFGKLNLSETLSLLLFEGAQHSGANLDETVGGYQVCALLLACRIQVRCEPHATPCRNQRTHRLDYEEE